MEMSTDDYGMGGDYEEEDTGQHDMSIEMAKGEVESLPNYDMYESDGGESLSDGGLSLSEYVFCWHLNFCLYMYLHAVGFHFISLLFLVVIIW